MTNKEQLAIIVEGGVPLARLVAQRYRTQGEFAKAAGLSRPTVSRYLIGTSKPSSKYVPALCRALGVSIEDSVIFLPDSVDLQISKRRNEDLALKLAQANEALAELRHEVVSQRRDLKKLRKAVARVFAIVADPEKL